MNAKDIMTSPVLTVGPETSVREIAALLFVSVAPDTSVADIASLPESRGIKRVPVPGVRKVEDHHLLYQVVSCAL